MLIKVNHYCEQLVKTYSTIIKKGLLISKNLFNQATIIND